MANLPAATYRLQLNRGFTFDDAARVADYLAGLGVTHAYCSPILQAAPGSAHGYDVTDPTRLNEELGGAAGFETLRAALRRAGLKLLLDIVPNHMAIGGNENLWWRDVLEHGRSSRHAHCFDVDWGFGDDPRRVLLPVLGDHIGRALDAGDIRLCRGGEGFTFHYFEREFPVALASLDELLNHAARACKSGLLAALAESATGRHEDQETVRAALARLCETDETIAAAIDGAVAEWNADPAALDRLLSRQHYRLACWRMAREELGYRRFFDINSLIGLRVEDERVFAASHQLILERLRAGDVHGLRVDHPDGLRDPEGYLRRLRAAAPEAWIVVEKIVEPGERLPRSWPVAGTTGYDFLNQAGGLFVDPRGEVELTAFYHEYTGESADYEVVAREKKLLALRDVLGSDVNRLVERLRAVCRRHARHRDYTRARLQTALRELAASFPVYRAYVRDDPRQVSETDERCVAEAVESAKRHCPDADPALFDFLGDLLLLKLAGKQEADFALRFQQLTGPSMAKGIEDTTFYCFNRLVSLNEVGGHPGRFGVSPEAFHEFCAVLQTDWPETMLATSTHDTKRGEDVRARVSLISECPREWMAAVRRWTAINERHRRDGRPDRNAEYLLYQTLLGAWPIDRERLTAYMEKAAREAKAHTSWTDPNPAYDAALERFTSAVLADEAFLADFQAFLAPLIRFGRINGLAQTLLKLTAPGVPDIYQGTELWTLSLVDPDNRRPVDYELRRKLLAELEGLGPAEILAREDEGLPKLWVTRQALALRRRRPEAFGSESRYLPLHAHGDKAGHVVAFMRGDSVVTAVPRLVMGLDDGWRDTSLLLPKGDWHHPFTGRRFAGGEVALADLTAEFPVALLAREAI